jgi:hypothetical protein
MSRARKVEDIIKELEHNLVIQRAVLAQFPDAKAHWYNGFSSKLVNKKYTNFIFERRSRGLYVLPYCEVQYTFDGDTKSVKVFSQPRTNRLVYIGWRRGPDGRRTMKFSRLSFNLKNNQFKDDMLNACRTEIMSFIKTNPGYNLDDKHLEPRLRKLLIFT